MEDTLRVYGVEAISVVPNPKVLILVLMEDTLRELNLFGLNNLKRS